MTCHIPDKGYAVLGPETAQMNRMVSGSNQLDKLQALGVFEAPIPTPYKAALITPTTSQLGSPPASATVEQRATTYLHANCAFCHRPDDDVDCTSDPCLDLRFGLPLASRNICNVTPAKGGFGLTNPVTLAPGHPELSVMSIRMKAPPDDSSGRHGRMPLHRVLRGGPAGDGADRQLDHVNHRLPNPIDRASGRGSLAHTRVPVGLRERRGEGPVRSARGVCATLAIVRLWRRLAVAGGEACDSERRGCPRRRDGRCRRR